MSLSQKRAGRIMKRIFKDFQITFIEKYHNGQFEVVGSFENLVNLQVDEPKNKLHILNAGRQYSEERALAGYEVGRLDGKVMWLTNAFGTLPARDLEVLPNKKKIGRSDTEHLGIIKSQAGRFLERKITWIPGGQVDRDVIYEDGEIGRTEVNVSPIYLTIPAGATGYYVEVIDGVGNPKSMKAEYVFDDECHNNPVRFKFINFLGAEDSFTAIGVGEESIVADRKLFERDLPERNTELGQFGVSEIKSYERFIGNTGYVTQEQAEWLKELFHSKHVWVEKTGLAKGGGVRKTITRRFRNPVIIESSSVMVVDTRDSLVNISFTYRNAYNAVTR